MLCCNNKRALELSSYTCRQVQPSAKWADILRSLKATKCTFTGKFTYVHVYGHMDREVLWHLLSLPQQLNCVCNRLAKHAVTSAMTEGSHNRPTQLLTKKDVAVIIWRIKVTDDIFHTIRFQASKEAARKYWSNKEKNPWPNKCFDKVDWEHLDLARLSYWLPKYILMQCDKPFTGLGAMAPCIKSLTKSQDIISYRNFMEGYILTHFYAIPSFHLTMSSSYLNGTDWAKQFISKLLHVTHSQWIFCNIYLHDRITGYLHKKKSEEIKLELELLAGTALEDVPVESRFLLEINFSELSKFHTESQKYWILAVNAILTAKQCQFALGACARQVRDKVNRKLPS
jgi:hypothetical protein